MGMQSTPVLLVKYKCGCKSDKVSVFKCEIHNEPVDTVKKKCKECNKIMWIAFKKKQRIYCNQCAAKRKITRKNKILVKPSTPVIEYEMKCGCIIKKPLVINKRLTCPQHKKKGVAYIFKICKNCGKKMKLLHRQIIKVYCEQCGSERNKNAAKIQQREKSNTIEAIKMENTDYSLPNNDKFYSIDDWWLTESKKMEEYFKKLHKTTINTVIDHIKKHNHSLNA